jgi:hypothetical protein
MKPKYILVALLIGILFSAAMMIEVSGSSSNQLLHQDFYTFLPWDSDFENASQNSELGIEPAVSIQSSSGKTISFKTQNGWTVSDVPVEVKDIPYLVLFRNGVLTDPIERTLTIKVDGIQVPTQGITVTLEIETQHKDPDLEEKTNQRISVWRESRWLEGHSTETKQDATTTVIFNHEFAGTRGVNTERSTTPTDYFRYKVSVFEAGRSVAEPVLTIEEEFAFLLESQWIVQLPEAREESPGAAPDELVIYYCDMFPFQRSVLDGSTRLPRGEIHGYIRNELVPAILEAYRVQSNDWGFVWNGNWVSSRPEADADRLSVALTKNDTWFHGHSPWRGNSWISINVEGGVNAYYDNLTDGLISSFHHELFHNLQRNISLELGGGHDISGKEDVWEFFSEGMAVFASSVGMPQVQFSQNTKARAYLAQANAFVAGGGMHEGELNTSYKTIFPYRSAIYWRYLYEKCGGMTDGKEDPAAGMQLIRDILMVLYNKSVVDIYTSEDLVKFLPAILDQVLKSSNCPFKTYRDSLTNFAGAIYALGLADGRCIAPGIPSGCGFYDPNKLYSSPLHDTISYSQGGVTYPIEEQSQQLTAGIPNSFGMDFVEVILSPEQDGAPLTIEFSGNPNAAAEFNVEIWKLKSVERSKWYQRVLFPNPDGGHILSNADGWVYTLPEVDTSEFDRLALIITRVDNQENLDPRGEYRIFIR